MGAWEAIMGYAWNHDGVERAVEDAMREHPDLLQRYEIAAARDSSDFTWHVELDPLGERRVARLAWEMLEYGRLDDIAEQIREAKPAW
jgi:hypothetical protein